MNEFFACTLLLSLLCHPLAAAQTLDSEMHHLRGEGPREWAEFPHEPEDSSWQVTFESPANSQEWCLSLRQQDVKQNWVVRLNDKTLGSLTIDENDMRLYFPIPASSVRDGNNELTIAPSKHRSPDDIRVGELQLFRRSRQEVLGQALLRVSVTDPEGNDLPSRITIVDAEGCLQSTGAESSLQLAVRPGVLYTSDGRAEIPVPNGTYRIFAGRGFEYTLAEAEVRASVGQESEVALTISRVVDTKGWVACDTHVHTRTHSGHGDATVIERMVTLAGEGIELPIATDHNVQIDHEPFAQQTNLRRYFTPVIGNEVTTKTGHFNIFPVQPGADVPDHRSDDWGETLEGVFATPGVRVAILNHARDIHGGTVPFGPQLHNALVGVNREGWPMRFNAMEVINSGATQTDVVQLFRDWMALLNHGQQITPVGSSDSHDVARHFVGQGRTYIRCPDHDPAAIDVDLATASFLQGSVVVSYGLFADVRVNGKYRPGSCVSPAGKQLEIECDVLGPPWVNANRAQLFVNGKLHSEQRPAAASDSDGIRGRCRWTLPVPPHDLHLVVLALGPGVTQSYWKTAKPYQPKSIEWNPQVATASGAIWVDGDRDGRVSAPREYAERILATSRGDLTTAVKSLEKYDESIAVQTAYLLDQVGHSPFSAEVRKALHNAASHVQSAFQAYQRSLREAERVE